MDITIQIPEPFKLNPLKHHLSFIREFVSFRSSEEIRPEFKSLMKELRPIGNSTMDVYTGSLSVAGICKEVKQSLETKNLYDQKRFSEWTGMSCNDFKTISLSDESRWILKYNKDKNRYIHIFPARFSPLSFRVKANTLKSAILYTVFIGKNYISGEDLNQVRRLMDLSPVKDPADTGAITEMIEILRV